MTHKPVSNRDVHRIEIGWGTWVLGTIIVVVLVAVLFPVFAQAPNGPRRHSVASNIRQLLTTHSLYAVDNDDFLPPYANDWHLWQETINAYLKNIELFYVPLDPNWKVVGAMTTERGKPPGKPKWPRPSFRLNPILCSEPVRVSDVQNPDTTALIFERAPFLSKAQSPKNIVVFGMVDGAVKVRPWMRHADILNPFLGVSDDVKKP